MADTRPDLRFRGEDSRGMNPHRTQAQACRDYVDTQTDYGEQKTPGQKLDLG